MARPLMTEAPCSLAAMTNGAHGLSIDAERNDKVLDVRVRGELDMGTSAQLSAALGAAADEPVDEVTLDLSGVTFIDSSALRVLVLSGRALAESGRTLQIGPRSDLVARILTMTSLDTGGDGFRVLPQ
jgi:anti-sigma B factor antagonist